MKDLEPKDILQIAGVLLGAFIIIKGIVDGEEPIEALSNVIQKNINWGNPNMGSLG